LDYQLVEMASNLTKQQSAGGDKQKGKQQNLTLTLTLIQKMSFLLSLPLSERERAHADLSMPNVLGGRESALPVILT